MAKRKKKRKIKTFKSRARPAPTSVSESTLSAATLFRFMHLGPETRAYIEQENKSKLGPEVYLRFKNEIKKIKQADTPQELVDLAHLAKGVAETEWHNQARKFGPEIVPLISERLRTSTGIQDKDIRTHIVETLVGELRWRGEAGANVLLNRFENLDYHGRSLACVVFGLLGTVTAAYTLWNFYEKALGHKHTPYFVGPLWGLVDLDDEDYELADTLLELLYKKHYFAELYGLLARAGDERAIPHLLLETINLPEEEREEPLMAARGIAHRVGYEAVVAVLEEVADNDVEFVDKMLDGLFSNVSFDEIKSYFELFFKQPEPTSATVQANNP